MCVCVCMRGRVSLLSHCSLLFMIHGEYALLRDSLSSSRRIKICAFLSQISFCTFIRELEGTYC